MTRIACPGIGGRIMAGRISKAVINKLKHHGGQLNITCDGVVVATLRLEEPAQGGRDE